jgi:ribonuclease P protein component
LHKPREFSAVFSSHKVLHGELIVLHHAPGVTGIARMGLVIPKRLAKRSVLRNSIRRQAREAFRLRAADMPALDLVLRLTKPIKNSAAKRHEQAKSIRSDIERLISRVCGLGEA